MSMALDSREATGRQKLSEIARDLIREKIVYDEFGFGRVLRESELSQMLNMSKSPIREALSELAYEGLVVMSPNRSARVMQLSAGDMGDLAHLREMLEVDGLRMAMASDAAGLAAALDAQVQAGAAALEADDIEGFSRSDNEFHLEIFRHCGNRYLEQTFIQFAPRIQAMRTRLARERDRIRTSHATHTAIVAAVQAGELERAIDLLRDHVRDNADAYTDFCSTSRDIGAPPRVILAEMERFARAALEKVGADADTTEAVVRALAHASGLGVDTHGYRLLPHYLRGFAGGRLNPTPKLSFPRGTGGAAVLDADDAHGARAGYAAVDRAIELAREYGVGAVAIRASSHFGAAGAYATAIAEAGMAGLAVCNSDAFVRLHGGAERFHGTNPIAFAAPAGPGQAPWLLDMATSAIPYNKVLLSRSLNKALPEGTASDANGVDTTAPGIAEMLAPLGAAFGYKGAGLAGISEILSSALSDAPLSREIAPMVSDDMATPRGLGAFVLAIDPDAFMGRDVFQQVVSRYRAAIRASDAAPGQSVMAAGDREWEEGRRRRAHGITLDPTTIKELAEFAATHEIAPLGLDEDIDRADQNGH
ncbi:transcriptional regulator, GntR family [Palleronia salina]|uniref:Transcriptional regulator, GntR family n=1 Tax=Palleronia salina TaxID=313368 RepID=A0A1M6H2W7_9RHOB|nr:Ldh family oxidoreductase [Palleronia salina]SHJ16550.1 transcriptional regulator, GntR family [Palleronia salina]